MKRTGTEYIPISVITPTNSSSNISYNNSKKDKVSGRAGHVLVFGGLHNPDKSYMAEDDEEGNDDVIVSLSYQPYFDLLWRYDAEKSLY